jgi:hypothetical protein
MTDVLAGAVPEHEPPVGDAVQDIFRHAEAVRRRRVRALLAAAALAVAGVIAAGYALTGVLLPAAPRHSPAEAFAPGDPVLDVVRPVLRAAGLRVAAREPARGNGWRRYRVLAPNGRRRSARWWPRGSPPTRGSPPASASARGRARARLRTAATPRVRS